MTRRAARSCRRPWTALLAQVLRMHAAHSHSVRSQADRPESPPIRLSLPLAAVLSKLRRRSTTAPVRVLILGTWIALRQAREVEGRAGGGTPMRQARDHPRHAAMAQR